MKNLILVILIFATLTINAQPFLVGWGSKGTGTWTSKSIEEDRSNIAMSNNGQYQLTAIKNSPYSINISSNYGVSWTNKDVKSVHWRAFCVSGAGDFMMTFGYDDSLSYSLDHGATWDQREIPNLNWLDADMSSNGKYIVLLSVGPDSIYVSSDSGLTFSGKDKAGYWSKSAISDNGQYITVMYTHLISGWGYINVSSDYGATWTNKREEYGLDGIDMDATGQYQVACSYSDSIYVSSDYGATWTVKGGRLSYKGISMASNNHNYVTAVVSSDGVYYSSDFCENFGKYSLSANIYDIKISATGKYQSLVGENLYIYVNSIYGH